MRSGRLGSWSTIAWCTLAALALGARQRDGAYSEARQRDGDSGARQRDADSAAPQSDSGDSQPGPPRVGDLAPELGELTWLAGEPVKALERGKVYVVVFWAPWSGAS